MTFMSRSNGEIMPHSGGDTDGLMMKPFQENLKENSLESKSHQKFVHWNSKAQCRRVASLKACEPEMVKDIWYSKEEQELMSEGIDKLVNQILEGAIIDSRGLELRIPSERRHKSIIKARSIDAVIAEQQRLRFKKKEDDEFLSQAYQEFSIPSMAKARERGIQDEMDVKEGNCSKLIITLQPAKTLKRKVAFKTARIRPVTPLSYYSDELKEAIWYQAEEFAEMKQKIRLTVKAFHNQTLVESDEETLLGLANYLPGETKTKRSIRIRSTNAVLDEQDLQFLREELDEEKISLLYQNESMEASKDAYERALKNHDDIRAYTAEPMTFIATK